MDAYITIDTVYLHLKYPKRDVFDHWFEPVKYLDTRVLKNGCVVENLVVKTGAQGYKVSIWDHDARIYLTDTGKIDTHQKEVGLARSTLFRKNLRAWLDKVSLPYHSPHKFRHGHVHYGQALSRTQEDYKAVSQNVMHSTTGITDQFYSNIDDEEKKIKIDSMFV